MADVFEVEHGERSDAFVERLLARQEFWAIAAQLRADASALGFHELFVAADNEDAHALDFYRALGGAASSATIFSFTPR